MWRLKYLFMAHDIVAMLQRGMLSHDPFSFMCWIRVFHLPKRHPYAYR